MTIFLTTCSGSGSGGTKYVDLELGECDGIPDCISVTNKQSLQMNNASGEIITLRCPDDRPYFWDWGYKSSGGLKFTLLSTMGWLGEKKQDGVIIQVDKTNADDIIPQYNVSCGCSSIPRTSDKMMAILSGEDASDPSSTIPVMMVDPERTLLPDVGLSHGADKFGYVGQKVWLELANKEDPKDPPSQNKGITWNYSMTNELEEILQTPRDAWEKSIDELYFLASNACPDNRQVCNKPFNLQECSNQGDCSMFPGTTCQSVAATVNDAGFIPSPQEPKSLCMRPQDVLWNEVYKVMVTATKVVDITTLNQASQAPDGRFRDAIKNAITYLATTGREVKIRILIGHFTANMKGNPEELLNYILEDAKEISNCKLQVQVGYYEANDKVEFNWPWVVRDAILYMSMNHSKIVSADGALALVGGQNMYDDDYLSRHPARDVTLRIRGPAAYDAHVFATYLWNWVKDNMNKTDQVYAWTWTNIAGAPTYRKDADSLYLGKLDISERSKDIAKTTMFGVGRLGGQKDYFIKNPPLTANASDMAILNMFAAAKESIKISQQDVIWGPAAAMEGWPGRPYDPPYRHSVQDSWYNTPYVDKLADQLIAGKNVYVVVSNLWSRTGAGTPTSASYYNGLEPEAVGDMFHWTLSRKDSFRKLPHDEQGKILCKRLHIATLRFGQDANWNEKYSYNNKWLGFANHAKTIIIDDEAFYVGSHNFYPMNLQEYGLIIDDREQTGNYIKQYWEPLWNSSKKGGVCGDDVGECMFKSW